MGDVLGLQLNAATIKPVEWPLNRTKDPAHCAGSKVACHRALSTLLMHCSFNIHTLAEGNVLGEGGGGIGEGVLGGGGGGGGGGRGQQRSG